MISCRSTSLEREYKNAEHYVLENTQDNNVRYHLNLGAERKDGTLRVE
jgi:hypothetical protein